MEARLSYREELIKKTVRRRVSVMVDATPTFMISLWRAARATRIGACAIGRFDVVGSCGEKIYVTGSGTPAKILKKAATLCS
jgi:hypothetical protein